MKNPWYAKAYVFLLTKPQILKYSYTGLIIVG